MAAALTTAAATNVIAKKIILIFPLSLIKLSLNKKCYLKKRNKGELMKLLISRAMI